MKSIHDYVRDNDIDAVSSLLSNGTDVNERESETTLTPLIISCRGGFKSGCLGMVQLLLDKGADVNLQDKYNITPIILASWGCHYDIVKLLLENGANPNNMSKDGITALSKAREWNYTNIVELLVKSGATQ